MGIFADMLLAAGLRRHDQHVNHISNSLFGSLPEKGRCILCGGVDSGEFSNAKQIKLHAFSSRLQRAARKSLPTLCLYSGTLPPEGPDAAVRQLREQYPDKVVRLGQDISYLPFDRNVDVEDAMRILSGPVHIYVQKAQASPGEILSFLRTMLQLLHEHWPPEMFTFSNLDIMMQSFGKNAAEFLSTLPPDAVQQAEHSLNLSWSTGVDGFWKAFRSQCAVLGPPGVRRRSLYSCLADGKLCVLCSPPAGQEMLTAALLGEMEVFQKCRRDFCLIDYDVSCKTLESSSLYKLRRGRCFSSAAPSRVWVLQTASSFTPHCAALVSVLWTPTISSRCSSPTVSYIMSPSAWGTMRPLRLPECRSRPFLPTGF